jgi:hypothetical protein
MDEDSLQGEIEQMIEQHDEDGDHDLYAEIPLLGPQIPRKNKNGERDYFLREEAEIGSRDSAVGVATGYGLNHRGVEFESR